MDLFSSMSLNPPRAHLVVRGEFDAFSAGQLRQRLDEAVDRGCLHISIDASEVSFVDAGGLGTLVWLRNVVAPFGGTVVVSAASSRVRQIARLVGLDEQFDLDLLPDPQRCLLSRHSERASATRRECPGRHVVARSPDPRRARGQAATKMQNG